MIRDDLHSRFVTGQYHLWENWAITDVRFPNEADAVRKAGGVVIKVRRPFLENVLDEHPSEASVDLIAEDFLILNDGSLEDLEEKTLRIVDSLSVKK